MLARPLDDRCPGVLRPFSAGDGALVRLRRPGGRLDADTLRALSDLAEIFAAPFLQLTSRGNIQIRGLSDPVRSPFVEAVSALGLLPSSTHERVRNIVAAPGRDLDALVHQLDAALQADASLARLPGRWLFVVSDKAGEELSLPYDVAYQRISLTDGLIWCGNMSLSCRHEDAVSVLLDFARRFLLERENRAGSPLWNVRDLPPDADYFTAPTITGAYLRPSRTSVVNPDESLHSEAEEGVDAPLLVGIPLGLLTREQVNSLRSVGRDLVITAHRSIVVRDARREMRERDVAALYAAGLEPGGLRATTVTACIGAPFCRRTSTPTIELTRAALSRLPIDAARTHVVGCERACGAPKTDHVLVTAPASTDAILNAASRR